MVNYSAFLCALRGYFFLPESTESQSGDQSTYLSSHEKSNKNRFDHVAVCRSRLLRVIKPLIIEDAANVGTVDVTLRYNASVVNVTGAADGILMLP